VSSSPWPSLGRNDEITLDTIAGSLLRIFVRMEKLDASLGHLSRRITDLEARRERTMVSEAAC
jgi:hypothetical protein